MAARSENPEAQKGGQESSTGAPQAGGPKTGQGQWARAPTSAPDEGQESELAPRGPLKPEHRGRQPGASGSSRARSRCSEDLRRLKRRDASRKPLVRGRDRSRCRGDL